MDEFPNLGEIVDINKKISTVRSRGINISIMFQNLAQMKNRYPFDVWQEIIGNVDTQYFLGCTDPMTAEYVSNRTGDASVMVGSERYTKSPIMKSPVYNDTQSVGKRKLLTPDEVMRLPNDEAMIMLRGEKPIIVKKFDYTKYPQAEHLIYSSANNHVPEYQKPYGYTPPEMPKAQPEPKQSQKPPGIIKRFSRVIYGEINEKDI